MEIELEKGLHEQMQAMSPVSLQNSRDCGFFAEWLLQVGMATVRLALKNHPELTLGDLVMMQWRSVNNRDCH